MLALVNFTEQRVSACLYIVLFLPSLRVLFYDSRILFYESFLQIIIIFYLYFPSFIHPRLFFFVAKNLTEKLAVNFLLRKKLARNRSFFIQILLLGSFFFFLLLQGKKKNKKNINHSILLPWNEKKWFAFLSQMYYNNEKKKLKKKNSLNFLYKTNNVLASVIVIDPPRFNTIRLIESRLNRVHIGVSRFNRVSDHKYLNYRKRCGERYIHRKKERKKKEKKRRENASVTRKQGDHQRGGSLCVHEEERFSFTRLVLRSRDTSAILFSRSSRARSRVLHFRRGDISRSCEFPPSVLGLDTVEKVVEAGAWSDIGSGDRRSRSRLSPPRKSVEWLRSRTKEIMWRSSRCQVLVASRRSHDIPHPGIPTSTWH